MSLVNLAHVYSHLQNASKARLGLTSVPSSNLHLTLQRSLRFFIIQSSGQTTMPDSTSCHTRLFSPQTHNLHKPLCIKSKNDPQPPKKNLNLLLLQLCWIFQKKKVSQLVNAQDEVLRVQKIIHVLSVPHLNLRSSILPFFAAGITFSTVSASASPSAPAGRMEVFSIPYRLFGDRTACSARALYRG